MSSYSLPNGYGPAHTNAKMANLGSGGWIVQKYGGTSVARYALAIIDDIVRSRLLSHKVAIVCSARSSKSKYEGTTNRLLQATREAGIVGSVQYKDIIETIRKDHVQAAQGLIRGPDILNNLVHRINRDCCDLVDLLTSVQKTGHGVSHECGDRVISEGEKLSCQILAALLQDRGIDSEYVDLSSIINFEVHSFDQRFYARLAEAIAHRIMACGTRVPVITGYFGLVPGGFLDKVGRGYTDFCAALIAVGLNAVELQIWKEVDGIFTADPTKVPTAQLLPTITPSEAAELTFYGAEVIHPFTMEQVIGAKIPIRIANVRNPRCNGTIVFPDLQPKKFNAEVPKRPTAVTSKRGITLINITSNKRVNQARFLFEIFATLDKHALDVELFSKSEVQVSLALHSKSPMISDGKEEERRVYSESLQSVINELVEYGTIDVVENMAILSLVGKQLKKMTGIAGKFFATLGEADINLEMISQGASEINISCVIENRHVDRALSVVHTGLFTFLD